MLVAMPHRIEATVNPPMAINNRRRRPITDDSQPVAGVAMAAATMYDVSTHDT